MNWTQQMDEMSKQWNDVQKKLWTSWQEAAQQASPQGQAKAMWQQMFTTWKNMLDMQVESVRLWSESVVTGGAPDATVQWAEQFYQMTKQSSNVQKQLWDSWFSMVDQVDLAAMPNMPNMMNMNSQPMVKLWQEMAQQTTKMQQEWLKNVNAWQPGKKG